MISMKYYDCIALPQSAQRRKRSLLGSRSRLFDHRCVRLHLKLIGFLDGAAGDLSLISQEYLQFVEVHGELLLQIRSGSVQHRRERVE